MTGYLVKDNKCLNRWKDGGWKTLEISATGITAGTVATQYRVVNDRVYLRGQIVVDMSTASLPVIFATLPEGARPAAGKYELVAGEGDRMARIFVDTTGAVYINYFKTYAGDAVTGSHWVQIDTDLWTN